MKITALSVLALGSAVVAQDLSALLGTCASNQFQELGLKGVDGDPCKSDAGKPSYYKCSCIEGKDFVPKYLCKNPGSCTPGDIPKLSDILVSFCKSVGVTVQAPEDPCGLKGAGIGGGGGGAPPPPAAAPAPAPQEPAPNVPAGTTPLATTPAGTAPPGGTVVGGTPVTPVTPATGTPTSFTGAAAQYNYAPGLAGLAGVAGLLVL
ncbi:uncharacterized protein J3D65DRAFT_599548 [Phyllosticta citribraziliensis]|uniref:Uncharacterized protein n=1 Tax=Phyllosticta citribraziliensis TaxID=989973 RepID=A0ABR1MCC0_9PEZI